MQSRSQSRDGRRGGEYVATLAPATIRRNGHRHEAVNLVPRRYASTTAGARRRHWSSARVQSRLIAFRPGTGAAGTTGVSPRATRVAETGRSRTFGREILLAFLIAAMGLFAAARSYAPPVTTSVALPDGRTQDVTDRTAFKAAAPDAPPPATRSNSTS